MITFLKKQKLFFTVWILAMLGVAAALPFLLTTQADQLQGLELPFPPAVLLLLAVMQNGLLLGMMTAVGLFLAKRVGLGLPFVEAWLNKTPPPEAWRRVRTSAIVMGIVAALIVIGLETLYFVPQMAAAGLSFPESTQPPIWQSFLASFYGGITEEVMVRLFLMTLLVWLGGKVSHTGEGQPTPTIFWLAIVIAAIIFGLGHLPTTAALGVPLNNLIVTRAILLNGIPGIVFGWLYWKRGLESAMVAHFSADIVLHVIAPLFLGVI